MKQYYCHVNNITPDILRVINKSKRIDLTKRQIIKLIGISLLLRKQKRIFCNEINWDESLLLSKIFYNIK